eukprot:g12621.t1
MSPVQLDLCWIMLALFQAFLTQNTFSVVKRVMCMLCRVSTAEVGFCVEKRRTGWAGSTGTDAPARRRSSSRLRTTKATTEGRPGRVVNVASSTCLCPTCLPTNARGVTPGGPLSFPSLASASMPKFQAGVVLPRLLSALLRLCWDLNFWPHEICQEGVWCAYVAHFCPDPCLIAVFYQS